MPPAPPPASRPDAPIAAATGARCGLLPWHPDPLQGLAQAPDAGSRKRAVCRAAVVTNRAARGRGRGPVVRLGLVDRGGRLTSGWQWRCGGTGGLLEQRAAGAERHHGADPAADRRHAGQPGFTQHQGGPEAAGQLDQ